MAKKIQRIELKQLEKRIYYMTKNLNSIELTNQIANSNFQQFQTIWNSGLVVFGIHIFLVGILWCLTLTMAVGELGLAVWLLIKGGKETKIKNEISR